MSFQRNRQTNHGRAAARRRAIAAATVLVALAAVAVALFMSGGKGSRGGADASQLTPSGSLSDPPIGLAGRRIAEAEVSIRTPLHVRPVPRSFLGLSTEYWSLPVYERHMPILDRVISLLHVPGDGPFVLRVGGHSADHMVWEASHRSVPGWEFAVTPRWLRRTSTLVRRTGLRLIIDLNLITSSPRAAARWARAAERGLPSGSIASFEVGNEPNVYSRNSWLKAVTGRVVPVSVDFLPRSLSSYQYVRDFMAYRHLLKRIAPAVPLAGPAIGNPIRSIGWIPRLIYGTRGGVGLVTAHHYLFSACRPRHSPGYPTVSRLLGEPASAHMAQRLEPAVQAAHAAGLQFRLTELNSVSCLGLPGVSNAFVTALWSSDALFELLRVGVDGVNVHVRSDAINAAFAITSQGLEARPLLYGLIMVARTLSPDPALVRARVSAPQSTHLKVWAVRAGRKTLHVLLINKGAAPVRVRLPLPGRGPASVERLLAASPNSTSGVTLAGQHLGADGRWHGRLRIELLRRSHGEYVALVPAYSAALMSVGLRH